MLSRMINSNLKTKNFSKKFQKYVGKKSTTKLYPEQQFFSKRDITLLAPDWLRKNPLNQSEAMSRLGLTKQTKSHFLALFIPIFMFLKVLNPFFSPLEGFMETYFH